MKKIESYSYGCIMAVLPEPVASRIRDFGKLIPDEDLWDDGSEENGREEQIHCTVKYGLHTEDPKDVEAVVGDQPPATLTLLGMSAFHNEDNVVLKLDVASPDLHRLNGMISKKLECTDSHPEYHPHVTVAYLRHREDDPYWYQKLFSDMFKDEEVEVDRLRFSTPAGKEHWLPLTGVKTKAPARAAMSERVASLSSVLKQGQPFKGGWYAVARNRPGLVLVGPFDKAHAIVVQVLLDGGKKPLRKYELMVQEYSDGQARSMQDDPEDLGYDEIVVLDVDRARYPVKVDAEKAKDYLKMVKDARLAAKVASRVAITERVVRRFAAPHLFVECDGKSTPVDMYIELYGTGRLDPKYERVLKKYDLTEDGVFKMRGAKEDISGIEKKIRSSVVDEVYDVVFKKGHGYCAYDPDGSIQCHDSLYIAAKELSDYWWFKDLKMHRWNESRWKQVAQRLIEDGAIKKFKHRAIRELIEDIADFTVNGHSFMSFKGKYIDPHLKSKGVPDGQIQKFCKYFEKIM